MQTVYQANMLKAFAGMRAAIGDVYYTRTYVNDKGSTRKVVDVVPTVVNSHLYQFEVEGVAVYYQADASATAAEIRDGLIAYFRTLLELEKLATVNPNGNNVRVTARQAGYDLSVTESNAQLALSTVVAHAAAQAIPFGSAVVKRTGTGTNDKSCMLPSAPTAKVIRIAVTAATNDKKYEFWVRIPGLGSFYIDFTADGSATQAEIATGIAARVEAIANLPVSAAVAASTNVDLTSDVPGVDFFVDELDAELTQTTTTENVSLHLLGVVERTPSIVSPTNADPNNLGEAAPYNDLTVISRGPVWVATEQVVTPTDPVYYRHTAGSASVLGRFRKDSDSGTANLIESASWRTTSQNGLAIVDLNLP